MRIVTEQLPQGATASRPLSGAQAIVQALLEQDVQVLFGYPGGAIMPTYDALYDVGDRLRHVLVRHEQGAAHAAQGYARATGRTGVCIATSGPGATNLATPLVDALMDSTPLVCITGQVPRAALGTDAFQEADAIGITLAATKWSYQITAADEIPWVIPRAFEIARAGRPGPVLIDITKDAQQARLSTAPTPPATRHYDHWRYPREPGDLSGLERAAELINTADRPYMILGQGVLLAGAEEQARRLAEKAGIPTASTLLGLSALAVDHPLFMGMVGMHGHYGPNILTNEADVIMAVGMRFDDRVTGRVQDYAPQARIIHIEIDPAEVNKVVPAEVALIGDARRVLDKLLPHIAPARHPRWLERFQSCAAEEERRVIAPEIHPLAGPLKMGEVVERLSVHSRGEAVIVSDVGQHQMFAARHYRFSQPRSHITSGGLGTMGFALPAAIGARIGVTDRPVVAVIGDGGFQMTLQELGTVMQERLPVKLVVLNNEHLGMVRQWQELFFDKRYSSVAMASPDFITVARGYGIAGRRITQRAELDQALGELLECDGPYLLEVAVGREDKIFPMIPAGASVTEIRLD